jgi:uncharacterized repeat protein (TIGR03803 family)
VSNPDTASTGTYVMGGNSTTLGVSGNTTAVCNQCPAMTLTPSSPLTFNAQVGGSAPPPQSIAVSTGSTVLAYAVTIAEAGGNWLNVTPGGGQTGTSFSVGVTQQGLAAGTYNGSVSVYTAASNSPQTLAVTMVVYTPGNLIATPASFSFESAMGIAPPAQTLSVTDSSSGAVAYTAAVSTSDGHSWLSVSPTSGTTGGAPLSVAADVTQVPRAGTYHGTITLTATGVVNPLTVPVTLRLLGSLYSFAGGNDGAGPAAPVTIGRGNVLYGTTVEGGPSNLGTVFSLTPSATPGGPWTEEAIYTFAGGADGANPRTGLVAYSGLFYGVTEAGGTPGFGTVFSLKRSGSGGWTEKVLYSFNNGKDGAYPQGLLLLSKGGVLYGTTTYGGKYGRGTVYSLTKPGSAGGSWTEAVVHDFGASGDGANPYAGLVVGSGGVLYGTTYSGGSASSGTVYSLTPPATTGAPWTEAVIFSFTGAGDGGNPYAGVLVGQGGVLYGTTHGGGSQHGGVVFSLTPPVTPGDPWTEAVLYDFAFVSGQLPRGGLVLRSGALYGATSVGGRVKGDLGTLFALLPPASAGDPWVYNVLHTFMGPDGATPLGGLALSAEGILYGTTSAGGSSNLGTVFLITP